jgi:CBS domain-containing protein
MIAADIMTRALVTVAPETPLDEVIRLLLEKRVGALPVVQDGAVVGLVGEADLLHRAELGTEPRPTSWLGLFVSDAARATAFVQGHGKLARDVMSAPVAVAEDTPLADVAALLERRGIGRVPVLRDGRLIGTVGRSDILRALASRLNPLPPRSADDQRLRDDVVAAIEATGALAETSDMTVVVEGGVVHLWGGVDGDAIHRALVVAAGGVPGVGEVRDHLTPLDRPDPMDRPNWPDPGVRVGG